MLDFILLLLLATALKDKNVKVYSFTIPFFQNSGMKTVYRNNQTSKKTPKEVIKDDSVVDNIITVPFTEVKDE